MKVLLIEDNPTIARQTVEFLEAHGWIVDHAATGAAGIRLSLAEVFDVILLDLNLPDIDGLEICREIRSQSDATPGILMVTARDSFEDKAQGFHQGADDYLTKPFDLRELALRCQALSRRSELHRNKRITLGELKIDLARQQVTRQDKPVKLTHIGFRILTVLAKAHPEPVARNILTHKVWEDTPPESDALKSHIYSLRKALDKPFSYPMLKTILNVGFKLEVK